MKVGLSGVLSTLRGKIILLCGMLVLVVATLVGGLNHIRSSDRMLEAATEGLAAETRLMAVRFQESYNTVQNETRIVSRTPPIKGLMRSMANNDIDPTDGSTTTLWRKRLETIFISVMKESPYYTQMRYIGLRNKGRELVRVNRTKNGFDAVPVSKLQQKWSEPYLRAVSKGRTSFYFSKVTFNREHGHIDEALTPTIRAIMPVTDEQNKAFGVVVINVNFYELMKHMFHAAKPGKKAYLTNQSGDYVEYDPETDGTHLEFHERYTKPVPAFIKAIQQDRQTEALFNEKNDVIAYAVMKIDKSTNNEYVGAVLRVPRDELLAGVYETRRESLLLTALLILFSVSGVAIIAHKLTSPLKEMTRNIRNYKKSHKVLNLPIDRSDEVGELARAFRDLVDNLTESELTRKAYVDASGDGYWDWLIQEDYEYMSPRFWDMLGYKPEEKKHKPSEWQKHIFEEDRKKVLNNFESHVASRGKKPFSQEVRYRHKDNSMVTMLCKGEVIEWAEDGTPIRMIGTHTNLTELRKAQEQLYLLDLAVNQSQDLILITDANLDDPKIIFASAAAENVSGYTSEELVGASFNILQGKETDRSQLEAMRVALSDQKPFSTEIINYRKNGEKYWVNINIVPVKDAQGKIHCFAAIERDITPRKAADAEREKLIKMLEASNRELDEFAYIASHDLKSPLRVIDNASQWLEEDLDPHLDEESKENLGLLRSRVMRMEKLLDDLLEYSRIGRKMDGSNNDIISGGTISTTISKLLTPSSKFTIKFDPNFAKHNFPRMPLQHILHNLIDNAIKHHDKEYGTVDVLLDDSGDYFTFSVNDDGPGISSEYQDKIFKMFQTLKPRDQVEGSGMGLALVKKHIENVGGVISVHSEAGKGATFSFTWPKNKVEKEQ